MHQNGRGQNKNINERSERKQIPSNHANSKIKYYNSFRK